MSQDTSSALRVLHVPELVGGHPGQLAIAEREIGLRSRCVSFWRHPFGYPCDEVLSEARKHGPAMELKRLRLMWRALREFDVVHFNFGTPLSPQPLDGGPRSAALVRRLYNAYASLVEFRDLPLLKLAGKAVFVTYQGDDARQGAFCREHFSVSPIEEVDPAYYSPESDARKQHGIRTFDRYADGIFALNPDLLHVLPPRARFLPYAHIDPRNWRPTRAAAASSRQLVVHAPSHRGVKGTRFVLDAVSRLRSEGVEFDFMLIEGMPNDEARRVYEKADVLVDQLLLGWYGGIAVEAMALGKPVVCYIREEDLRFLEPEMRAQLPVIRAEPVTIYDVLKGCLTTQRLRLAEIGARGRAYVERWHDPIAIARILRREYEAAVSTKNRFLARRTVP
jgi:glycosyltransferase involved in cell wall biosynthesis